jgi:DTW domain-containing protein YfiP
VLLQHPREADVAIGTARMASLALENSELHVGVSFRRSPELQRALSDPTRPPALLWPGPGAIDVASHPPKGPVTLIVVDGTWWQAKKLVRKNPELASLPRYAFTPPWPSEYRIRKEPHESYVSTIEALAHVLGVLEDDPPRFRALLAPFRAMIDAQIDCQARFAGGCADGSTTPRPGRARAVHAPRKRPRRPRLPECLHARGEDLVCVVGEANAWPYRMREGAAYPDELVHWVARRLATGETLEVIVAPRSPLAPSTTAHTRLSREALESGATVAELLDRWRAFVRDTDVVCSWGRYATSLFARLGGILPEARVDLRHVARLEKMGRVGTLEGFASGLEVRLRPRDVPGRAGERLDQVAAIADHFRDAARAERDACRFA